MPDKSKNKKMISEDWDHLQYLSAANLSPMGRLHYDELLDRTIEEEEHPEDYDGPCFCELCRSYGD